MGNKISRRRDASAKSAETAATEQKTAEESEIQEAGETGDLDVAVGEPVTLVACLPSEECVSECTEVEAPAATLATQNDKQQPEAKATPAPVQSELFSSSEPLPKSEPAAEAQPALEPSPEPVCISHPAPVEDLEQQTGLLTQESLPKPVISSPPLIDLGVPDLTPQPVNTPPSTNPNPTPFNADEPSDIPVTEECHDRAEAAEISTFETEKPEEAPEALEEPTEAAVNLEQLVSKVSEDSISGLLINLELQGNDLVSDLIPSDVMFTDDTPITDISSSTELM